jgi:hypothetical protein
VGLESWLARPNSVKPIEHPAFSKMARMWRARSSDRIGLFSLSVIVCIGSLSTIGPLYGTSFYGIE